MPSRVCEYLCRQFAVGAALGALLATVMFVGETFLFRTIEQGESPELTATVVASCLTFYCGIGAALSGFVLLVSATR